MAEVTNQQLYIKFITNLVTTVRQISIYPANHPIIVNSLKSIFSALTEIVKASNADFSISMSPEQKLLLNSEPFADKNAGLIQDFVPLFKKLEVEELTFETAITQDEINELVKILITDGNLIRQAGDINKLFSERKITHLKAKQFAYLKVEKGKEATVIEGTLSALDRLKSRIKELSEKKTEKTEDVQIIEQDLFELIRQEFKEHKKVSSGLRTLLRKFVKHSNEEDPLGKLRTALLDYGCPEEEVDKLLQKINEEITQGEQPRKRVSTRDLELLQKENDELKDRLAGLQQEVGRHVAAVEHLQRENKRVISERQRIDNIVHNMAEGMVVVDAEGKIILVNSAAEALLGISKADVGKQIKDVVKDEHLLTVTKQFKPKEDGVVEQDIELMSANEDTRKVLRASQAVVEDNSGNTVGMVTMLNDVTKQKEVERVKSEFLSTVSHELRTPLVAIEKSVSLILDQSAGEVSEQQKQFLSIAERNLKRLTLLINDLLDLSKLEARKMELKRDQASIERVIDETVETLANWAKTKDITLEKSIGQGIPEIYMDPNRMTQVLTNLIGNSIKFTPQGGKITVEAVLRQPEELIQVCVQDTGAGIAAEDLPKLFTKFYQSKDRPASDISGTGIGLAIVREIVQLHGGDVWAESPPGQGARFIFTVPLTKPQEKTE